MPSATSSNPNSGSKSGIVTTETGERHIPSSVRADGSKRKEIKIRPGYKPPEDVEVYRNRTAEAWKTRGKGGGIPGASSLHDDENDAPGGSGANNKNAKRREARKKAKAAESSALDPLSNGTSDSLPPTKPTASLDPFLLQNLSLQDNNNNASQTTSAPPSNPPSITTSTPAPEPQPDPAIEQDKLVRNLNKKLRQARELRDKKDSGESLLPEQFEKVIKIKELIRQLDALGYDAEGEPKEKLIDI